ncbi:MULTISPECIES: FG-GAP-like repeat-containing protein [unclassified Streptomyces]|uniref:FG-GAP-like repeat-containing protein n=1 Tax=unclassified Streptomyces TaxID=2593676 RepID=UPI000AB38B07|nr:MULTISPECIES: FG-GAP-like repeat-containing protein [unclassified Streptomyces]
MRRQTDHPLARAVISMAALGGLLAALFIAAKPSLPWTDGTDKAAAAQVQAAPGPVMFPLFGRKSGRLYDYEPKVGGGFKPMVDMGGDWAEADAIVQANVSEGGTGNDLYHRVDGTLFYTAERGNDTKVVGGGWQIYDELVSVGNMGGTAEPDLVARQTDGTLWLYAARPDGLLQPRIRIGSGGWGAMTALVGRGDYTGDGKTDLIARQSDGTLYLYPGTGNYVADGVLGARVAVGTGWNIHKLIASSGDNNGDGRTDLIAADTAGLLWLFKGTGVAGTPFAPRVQIGTGGWAAFDHLF